MNILDLIIQLIIILVILSVIAVMIYGPYFLIMHVIDKPLRQRVFKQRKSYKERFSPNNKHFTIVFDSIIGMLTKIAKSDGVISELEADVIKDTISHFVSIARLEGLSTSKLAKLRKQLVQVHNDAKSTHNTIDTYAKNLIHYDFYMRIQVLQQLIFMASIDGYTPLKESLIMNAGSALGFGHSQIRSHIDDILGLKKESPKKESSAYTVLGCKSTDDNATIKKKYRELVKKYHPDFGEDEASLDYRKQKMQEINTQLPFITA